MCFQGKYRTISLWTPILFARPHYSAISGLYSRWTWCQLQRWALGVLIRRKSHQAIVSFLPRLTKFLFEGAKLSSHYAHQHECGHFTSWGKDSQDRCTEGRKILTELYDQWIMQGRGKQISPSWRGLPLFRPGIHEANTICGFSGKESRSHWKAWKMPGTTRWRTCLPRLTLRCSGVSYVDQQIGSTLSFRREQQLSRLWQS